MQPDVPEETTTTTTTETTTTTTTTTTVTETTTTTAETTTTSESITEQQRKLTGDVDCSGLVELADAVLLAKAAAGGAELSVQGAVNAECDGAAGINSGDLTAMLNYLAGIIDRFPV